jgi:hypothetical protein
MSRVNTIDLLSEYSDKEYVVEYKKLLNLISEWGTYCINNENISMEQLFNRYILNWKYRNTYTSLKEIYDKLKLNVRANVRTVNDKLLTLIELVLNIDSFIDDIIYENNSKHRNDPFSEIYLIYKNNTLIFDNCCKLMTALNYKSNIIDDKITLVKNEVDVHTTTNENISKELSILLTEYIYFKNKNNVKEKKRIVSDIAIYLEPLRNDIPNEKLRSTIFKIFNKLNIRHNNKEGKNSSEFITKMSNSEVIEWYDRCFSLCLTAIRLVDFEKTKNIYDVFN